MTKMLVFDMDGTIANLYGVDGWLEDLHNGNTRPYEIAKPLYDMTELAEVLNMLKTHGWRIAITTWLAMDGTKEYNKRTAEAKKEWLARHNFPYDEIHCVKYGTTKANCTRHKAECTTGGARSRSWIYRTTMMVPIRVSKHPAAGFLRRGTRSRSSAMSAYHFPTPMAAEPDGRR